MLRRLFQPGTLPIGIDIGASGVKLLQLRTPSAGQSSLEAIARADVPPVPGEGVDHPDHLTRLIEAVARKVCEGGFRGSRCVLSIDDRLLRIRSVRQPHMPLNEIDKAARLDAPTRLGFTEPSECQVGWLLAGEVRQGDDSRDELIYVGAQTAPVERLVYGLADAGLRPLAVEPGFIATARVMTRTLRRAADQAVVRLLVDIGSETTGVILTRGRSVAFYKQLEFGGHAMTRAASERLALEPATIQDLRRQRMLSASGLGEPIDPKVDRALYDAVRPLLGDLAHEVGLCLRYYSVTFRGAKPETCVLLGGEAAEPRLAECFQESLHIPASTGKPLEGVRVRDGLRGGVDRSPGAEWCVAAGLSMRVREDTRSRRREIIDRRGDEPAAVIGKSADRGRAASREAA